MRLDIDVYDPRVALLRELVVGACAAFARAVACLRPWGPLGLAGYDSTDRLCMEDELRRVFAERLAAGDATDEAHRVAAATVQLVEVRNYGPERVVHPVGLIIHLAAARAAAQEAFQLAIGLRRKLGDERLLVALQAADLYDFVIRLFERDLRTAYATVQELQAIARALPSGVWFYEDDDREDDEAGPLDPAPAGAAAAPTEEPGADRAA
jgi:hypothetical protein